MKLKDKVTILIPTHFMKSAPSTKLIERVLKCINFPEFEECRCIINFDMPIQKKENHLKYEKNLEELKSSKFFDIEVYSTVGGQRKSFLNLIDKVTTEYFLFVEHDWEFKEHPDFNKIVGLMDRHKEVNYILFNKRKNEKILGDWILEDAKYEDVPLLKTTRFSNNPYIARTSKWINSWRHLVIKDKSRLKKPRGQVEYIMFDYWKEIKNKSFSEVHKNWGTYLYGEMGRPPVVYHLDGNNFK